MNNEKTADVEQSSYTIHVDPLFSSPTEATERS